jgi:hypothetical protein
MPSCQAPGFSAYDAPAERERAESPMRDALRERPEPLEPEIIQMNSNLKTSIALAASALLGLSVGACGGGSAQESATTTETSTSAGDETTTTTTTTGGT